MAKRYEGRLATAIKAVLATAPDGLPTPEIRRLAGIPDPGACFKSLQRGEAAGVVRRVGTVKLRWGLPAVVWALAVPEDGDD